MPPGGQRLPKAPDASRSRLHPRLHHADGRRVLLAGPRPAAGGTRLGAGASAPPFHARDADFGPPSWDRTFSLSPVPGVLNARDLVVEVTGAGNGQTAIRVDAQVSWQPPRPAFERVPSAARVVTISQLPSLDPHARRPPAPVTITGLAVVRRLAALVDSLQLSTIGPAAPCPAPLGGGIQLTFRARAGGPPLAVAKGPAACGTVQLASAASRSPCSRSRTRSSRRSSSSPACPGRSRRTPGQWMSARPALAGHDRPSIDRSAA